MANLMNDDIIYTLCSYLDVVSLSCLAAAHPRWSTVVHHYLKNTIMCFSLKLNFSRAADVECTVTGSFSPGTIEYKTDRSGWKKIPEYAWKYLPLTVIPVYALEITQVTVSSLEYEFCRLDVARRVLQEVTLCPGGSADLGYASADESGEPLLPRDYLTKFKSLRYSGDIVTFERDLFAMMDFDRVEIYIDGDISAPLACWMDVFVEVAHFSMTISVSN
ncbi:unnamed protein product [Heligmosomoides polygyrus]|uniref:F-box domain-containing protein n=1 Tax=Heligmosomoides polygyrus TaxID=6339 RepID=A0A183G3Z0_HELPZ|nr:unnamed protein product [Heligmosomoides polygyrus]